MDRRCRRAPQQRGDSMGEQRERPTWTLATVDQPGQGCSARCSARKGAGCLAGLTRPDSRYRKPTNYGQLVGRGQGVRPVADGAPHHMRPPTGPPFGGGPFPGYGPGTVQSGANRHEILLTEVSFRTLTASGAFVCLEKGRVDPFSRGWTRDRKVERRVAAPGGWAFCQSEPPRELPRTLAHPPRPGPRHRQIR